MWLWGENWRDSHQNPCVESLSHITDTIILVWSTPPYHMASAWKNASAPPCRACTLLRNQLPGSGCRNLGRLRECQWLTCVALGQIPFPPHSWELDRCLTLTGNPLLPLSGLSEATHSWHLVTSPCQGLGIIRDQLCGSEAGTTPPTFSEAWMAPPPHRRSTNPALPTIRSPALLKSVSEQNLGQTELHGSRTSDILPLHTQAVQSPPFTPSNLTLFGPDKLLASPWKLPETLPPPNKGAEAPSKWKLDLVYPGTFAKGPQTQHGHQVWTCTYLVDTTCPNLVTHWEPTSYNSSTARC